MCMWQIKFDLIRSCSGSCWIQTWCISTACYGVAERTVYDLGGWSLIQFLGRSSDTAWYRGPGWQEARPQWSTGPSAPSPVAPCGQMPRCCQTRRWCSQSRFSQWCSCRTFWGSDGQSWQIMSPGQKSVPLCITMRSDKLLASVAISTVWWPNE